MRGYETTTFWQRMTSLGWSPDDKNHDSDVKNDDDKFDDVISVLFRRKQSGLEKHRPVLDSFSFLLQIAVISGYGLSARNENWISVAHLPLVFGVLVG